MGRISQVEEGKGYLRKETKYKGRQDVKDTKVTPLKRWKRMLGGVKSV